IVRRSDRSVEPVGRVDEAVARVSHPARLDIARARFYSLTPRRRYVLEYAAALDVAGGRDDIVGHVGAVGADLPVEAAVPRRQIAAQACLIGARHDLPQWRIGHERTFDQAWPAR